jgi:hypothetical protein
MNICCNTCHAPLNDDNSIIMTNSHIFYHRHCFYFTIENYCTIQEICSFKNIKEKYFSLNDKSVNRTVKQTPMKILKAAY